MGGVFGGWGWGLLPLVWEQEPPPGSPSSLNPAPRPFCSEAARLQHQRGNEAKWIFKALLSFPAIGPKSRQS